MRSFLKKYKLYINIFLVLALALLSIDYFIEYPEAKNKKMGLVSGITFGLMAIIKIVDILEMYKSKRKAE